MLSAFMGKDGCGDWIARNAESWRILDRRVRGADGVEGREVKDLAVQ